MVYVLYIELEDNIKKDKEKKVETEELLGSRLAEERFALLVNLGKKITDFGVLLKPKNLLHNKFTHPHL